ncbi:unnamed protein product [Gongylonema pulchrum]|uniref:C1q domain-containing protein n=1 Tax=Gongylonema pulchrum TaxID=637853 RepID=A0A183EPY8_9BILA|nr:unnamed protein product [Gongylonema pulchrum]
MAYDDIAYNPANPYPGQVFNRPFGPNVYPGVIIDYKGDDVTPSNVIAILTGNSSAVKGGNGRVVESTAEDNIFVYFADHGATGIIAVIDDEVSFITQLTLLNINHYGSRSQ